MFKQNKEVDDLLKMIDDVIDLGTSVVRVTKKQFDMLKKNLLPHEQAYHTNVITYRQAMIVPYINGGNEEDRRVRR